MSAAPESPVPDPMMRQRLKERLAAIEERIAAACVRGGRARSDVTLVAVTKTVGAEIAGLLPELGMLDLGENRPQELWHKAACLPRAIRWHMIGHLQRNKVERTLPLAHLIHSVDSLRLLEALEQQGRETSVMLEVNASGEANKHGFGPFEMFSVAARLNELQRVRVCGLMTMAALQDPEACRREFKLLCNLRQRLRETVPPPHNLEHLSMGMSNDFEVAIEEGATYIRLGSALFEGLRP